MHQDDLTPIDDEILQTLLEEDAALLAGLPRTREGADPGLFDCLRLLEGLWPRGSPDRTNGGKVGRYVLLEEIGKGGFGVVYLALDPVEKRDVALKVPRPDVLFTDALRARFHREARTAKSLNHPNIVPVYDSGEDGPLCYIASAYCQGPTLSAWLRARAAPVPARLAARLIKGVASALQHAHDRGVLHRDVKPSNVLLEESDDPEAGTPRLTDFGLARLIEEAHEESRSGVPLGSPPYMAPEQAAGRVREVGPWTDVYSLGATLYETLTGRPPFRGETPQETLRQVCEYDPIPPRTLRPGLHRDIDTICLACLEKAPRNRYKSAGEVAEDLQRFLDGRPINARPRSRLTRIARRARRAPMEAVLSSAFAGAFVFVVLGLLALNVWLRGHNAELRRERDRAEAGERIARRHTFTSQVRLAQQAWHAGQPEFAQDLLASLRPGPGEGRPDPRGFAWFTLSRLIGRDVSALSGHSEWVSHLAVSPDGKTLASADGDGEVILWDLNDPRAIETLERVNASVNDLAFSPDGTHLLVSSKDQFGNGMVNIHPARGGPTVARLLPAHNHVRAGFAAPADGPTVFLAESGPGPRLSGLRLWKPLADAARPRGPGAALKPVRGPATGAHPSPDGRLLAVALEDGSLVMVDALGGSVRWRTDADTARPPFTFTTDGKTLAAGDGRGRTRFFDAGTGDVVGNSRGADFHPRFASFVPGTGDLIEGEIDGRVAIVDGRTRLRTIVRADGREDAWSVFALSADGGTLASGGRNGAQVTLWRVHPWKKLGQLPGKPVEAGSLAFTPDGKTLAVGCVDRRVRLWHLDPPRNPAPAGHPAEVWSLAFTPDGRTLVSAGDDFKTRLWDVATGGPRGVLEGHTNLVASLAIDRSGRTLVTGSFDRTVIVWDLVELRPRHVLRGHTDEVRAVAVARDGRTVASAGSDMSIRLWDAGTGRPLDDFRAHAEKIRGLAFSPDGKTLASVGNDRLLKLWPVDGPRRPLTINARAQLNAVAYAPDGSSVAAADNEGNVQLWSPETGEPLIRLRSDGRLLRTLAYSPDGRRIAAGGDARLIRVWDLVTGQELLALRGHAKKINAISFDPKCHWLATASHDGVVKLWDGRPH